MALSWTTNLSRKESSDKSEHQRFIRKFLKVDLGLSVVPSDISRTYEAQLSSRILSRPFKNADH